MNPPSRSRARHLLNLAIPFVGVGAGAVTVVLVHNPKALLPRPPYWPCTVGALGALAMVLALGLKDGWEEDDEVDHTERWRAAALAYVAGVVASITFVATVALLDRFG
jgi:hypothetical protein